MYFSLSHLKERLQHGIFFLNPQSIHSWVEFERVFWGKFGEDKTPAKLVLELTKMKMDSKEKVKDFNKHFLSLRNRIPEGSISTNDVIVKFYTLALPMNMANFV